MAYVTISGNVAKKNGVKETLSPQKIIEYTKNLRGSSLGLTPDKMQTIVVMGEVLLNSGFAPAFVSGVLGNIIYEGDIGQFESSAYLGQNAKNEPQYLKYMDEQYNYRSVFSGRNISEVGVSKTYEVLKKLEADGYQKGKFGLGSVQWTGERTMQLVKCYIDVVGEKGFPTREQSIQAEANMIRNEMNGSYHRVYTSWGSEYGYGNSSTSAYGAGDIVCRQYEEPRNTSAEAPERGKTAQRIFNAMTGAN
jgi:hypothetical protein